MDNIGKIFKLLISINWISIYINFKYLPFKQAIRFPILFFGPVSIHSLKGQVILPERLWPGMVRVGEGKVGIFEKRLKSVLDINGTLTFKGETRIGHGCGISVGENSLLEFGEMFKITAKSSIISTGGKKIVFGTGCLLSWDVLIMNTDFHPIYTSSDNARINYPADIIIGDNVWFGCRSTVLKNTTIASNSIIAANANVNKSLLLENCIYAGTPAKCVKDGVNWKWFE